MKRLLAIIVSFAMLLLVMLTAGSDGNNETTGTSGTSETTDTTADQKQRSRNKARVTRVHLLRQPEAMIPASLPELTGILLILSKSPTGLRTLTSVEQHL